MDLDLPAKLGKGRVVYNYFKDCEFGKVVQFGNGGYVGGVDEEFHRVGPLGVAGALAAVLAQRGGKRKKGMAVERVFAEGDRVGVLTTEPLGRVLDYLDEINWARYPALKTWYMVIKSRPCFRPLLNDKMPGVPASAHYKELDF